MNENGTFHHKLWLSKQFPWIADISGYFSNMVCKNLVKVVIKPVQFDTTAIIENEMREITFIIHYKNNSPEHQSNYGTYGSYSIIGIADEVRDRHMNDNGYEKIYEYYGDCKVIIYPF